MRRRMWVLAAAPLVVAVAVAGLVLGTSGAKQATAAARHLPAGVARVQRRTLSAAVSQGGILTYGDGSRYSLVDHARGIYTRLPAAGRVVAQGHVLYRVNNRPVVLLQGATPAYRDLSPGASGPDVVELNADLVALGYASSAQLRPRSAVFGSATAAAVKKLQTALGVPRTGRLTLGQAVFEPSAVRVTSVSAQLGGIAQPGETVLQGTSTRRQVQVAISAAQQSSMAVGDKVSITLPDNRTTSGVVSSVAKVATCPASSGSGPGSSSGSGPGSSSGAPGTGNCSSGGSQSSPATITVTVTPSRPAATGTWDQAPVQVGITTASVPDALVVPVTALVAEASGGYAVEVVGAGGRNHLLPVSLGLFDDADGLVQVSGPGIVAGQEVVVPGP